MMQAANLKDLELGMLLPGIKINTGPNDYFPIEQMQMTRAAPPRARSARKSPSYGASWPGNASRRPRSRNAPPTPPAPPFYQPDG